MPPWPAGGSVDLRAVCGRGNVAFCRHVCGVLAVEPVHGEPVSGKFPDKGLFTGNFVDFRCFADF